MKMILSKPIFAYLIDELASSIRTEVVESRHDELLVHDHGHFFPVNKLGDLWHC